MKEYKCMNCGKEKKAENDTVMVVCDGCQIEMKYMGFPEFCFIGKVLGGI